MPWISAQEEEHLRNRLGALAVENSSLSSSLKEAQLELARIKEITIRIDSDHWPLVVSKDSLLSQKEQMDISKIVNLAEYQSLRSFYLKTMIALFDQAGTKDPVTSNVILQFAHLLKDFVVDMDRMKIEHPEEQSPQVEFGQ